MRHFKNLRSLNMIDTFIFQHELAFLYLGEPNCSIDNSLLPQVLELMGKSPYVQLGQVDVTEVEAATSRFSLFATPALLLFVNGKEHIREVQIIHMPLFEEKLREIYSHVVG